jgi:23S rRNA (uracil1939-C5)-methyltransferase
MALKRPFQEGDRIAVTPARLGARGEAVADFQGWRVRIRGGIPGEAALVRILHVSKGGPVAVARFLEPAEAAHAARREPPCPIHERCGGCGLQHLPATSALELKVEQARSVLPEAGEWLPPIAAPRSFGYRAKTALIPQARGGSLMLGARPPRGDRLIDTSGCGVLRPELEALAARVRALLVSRTALAGRLRSVLLRCNRRGETQLTFVHTGDAGDLEQLAGRCGADRAFLQRHDRPGNVLFSDREERAVVGDGPLRERFCDEVEGVLPPTAFMQSNPDVAEALYDAAAGALEGPRIAELYCGAGVAGLLALRRHPEASLLGIDSSPRAIAAAGKSALRNGLADRCRFLVARAEEGLGGRFDAVLVNPPRAGCHAEVMQAIAASGAAHLVYLSCNPETLARDVRRLGWRLDSVRPADMLPQTPHLELLATLTRF